MYDSALIPLLVVLAAPAAGAPPPPAPRQEPATCMHRIQACTPGRDGWCTAQSPGGGFKVALPGRFNDFSMDARTEDGGSLVTHMVGLKTAEGLKLSVVAMVRGDRKVLPGALEGFGSRVGGQETPVRLAGLKGVSTTASRRGMSGTFVLLEGRDRLYLLNAEYPDGIAEAVAPVIARFHKSFRLAKPSAKVRPCVGTIGTTQPAAPETTPSR